MRQLSIILTLGNIAMFIVIAMVLFATGKDFVTYAGWGMAAMWAFIHVLNKLWEKTP